MSLSYHFALLILNPKNCEGISCVLFNEGVQKQIGHFPRQPQIKWTITIGILHVNI